MANGFSFTMRYTVNFEQATADFDISREHQLIVSQDGTSEQIDLAGDGYEAEIAYFLDCVGTGRSPVLVTADQAVTGLRILEAEQRSIESGSIERSDRAGGFAPRRPPNALSRGGPQAPLRSRGSLARSFASSSGRQAGGFAPAHPPTRSLAGAPKPRSAARLTRSLVRFIKRKAGGSGGGFAPAHPPTRFLAGAPKPRSVRAAHSLTRSLHQTEGRRGLRPRGDGSRPRRGAVGDLVSGIARLKPGVTLEQARANLAAVQQQLGEQYPKTDRPIAAAMTPLKEATVGGVGASLWLLFGAVPVLLLITCTNVTALLLARATERRHETSVRLSLGATRGTLAIQMLTEAGVLALAGGALGVAAAVGASAAFRFTAGDMPRMDELQVDWRILTDTLAVTMAVAFTCGLLPAIGAGRHGAFGASSGSGCGEVSSRHSLQWLFVGAQVGLSVTLLASAGLFVRSFHELSRVSPGFDSSHVLTFRMSGSWAETSDRPRLVRRIDDTLSGLRTVPGIDMAATATFSARPPRAVTSQCSSLPMGERTTVRRASLQKAARSHRNISQRCGSRSCAGEPCARQPIGSARDVMVNSAFVERYLSERPEPVGLHLSTPGSSSPPERIVGLVGNARERGLERPPGPVVYSVFQRAESDAVFPRSDGD